MKPTLLIAVLVLSLLAGTTSAARVTFTDGPVCTSGRLLIVSGTLAGLDDTDARIHVDATGVARVTCRDKDGKVMRKTENVPAVIIFDETISRDMIAAGHAGFFLTNGTPRVDARLAACGNPGWTSTIENVTFRTA